jgi:hypothetical protein
MIKKRSGSDNTRINYLFSIMVIMSLVLGLALLTLNLYGLTQSIRKPGLGVTDQNDLRFIPDEVKSYDESIKAINSLNHSYPDALLVEKANTIVHNSLVHVDWNRVDPVAYRQLIPIWENYFLYLLGMYSDLPQFKRYHYANYQRNIRRGIGICGDASTTLSSVLDKLEIENQILSFKNHVIVEVKDDSGKWLLFDPDFGVTLGISLDELIENPKTAWSKYLNAGYSKKEISYLFKTYNSDYTVFDSTYQFMKKRYVFEQVSYIAKWIVPAFLILIAIIYFYKYKSINIMQKRKK